MRGTENVKMKDMKLRKRNRSIATWVMYDDDDSCREAQ